MPPSFAKNLDYQRIEMPVYRFKTHEDAQRALWHEPGDPLIGPTLRALWSISSALAGGGAPPRGLKKFRSIEDANADRQRWEAERARLLRARRASAGHQVGAMPEPR